jgi:hypothetical protein
MKLTLAKSVSNGTKNHIWVMQQLMEIKCIKKLKNIPELLALGLRDVFHSTLNACYLLVIGRDKDEIKRLADQEDKKKFWNKSLSQFNLSVYGETFKWKKFPYLERKGDIEAPQYLHEAVIYYTTPMLAKLGIKNEANNEKKIANLILNKYGVEVKLGQDKSKTSFLEYTNSASENITGKTEMTHKNVKTLKQMKSVKNYIEFHLDKWKLKHITLNSLDEINNYHKFEFESYSYGLLVLYALIKVTDDRYKVRLICIYIFDVLIICISLQYCLRLEVMKYME